MNSCLKNKFRLQKNCIFLLISRSIKLFSGNKYSLEFSRLNRHLFTTNEHANTIAIKRVVPTISNSTKFNKYFGEYLKTKHKLALLLDYDGTLAPIAKNPKFTFMSTDVRDILKKLAVNPKIFLGVISGRGLEDVKSRVGIKNITYSGNHGIEIENSNGSRSDFILSDDLKKSYRDLVNELEKKVAYNGAWVEDKLISLSFHYRDVPSELVDEIKTNAIKIIEKFQFLAHSAHWAIEAKPPVNWHKGEAVKFILNKNFGENWNKINIIYAGDDTTDEDAMKAIQKKGLSLRITNDPTFETYGDYLLPNQNMMPEFLKWLLSVY